MFLVPVPEAWDPGRHGWCPAEVRNDSVGDDAVYLLRWAPPLRFPAVLAVFRNAATGQRVAWYGRLANVDASCEVSSNVLLAEIGVAPSDWGPEDRQPQVGRRGLR